MLHGCASNDTKPAQTKTSSPSGIVLADIDQIQYEQALDNMQKGELNSARNTLEKIATRQPKHFGVRLNLAIIAFQQDKLENAEKLAKEGLKLNEESADLYNLMGLISVEKKAFKEARASYEKAISLNDTLANAYYNLALLLDIYFQDIPAAFENYNFYLALEPDDQATKDWIDQLKYSLDSEWEEQLMLLIKHIRYFSFLLSLFLFFSVVSANTFAEEDRIELKTTVIKANTELPKILYVVPWQDTKQSNVKEQRLVLHSLFGDLFDPVGALPPSQVDLSDLENRQVTDDE